MFRRLLALLFAIGLVWPALPARAASDLQVTVRPGFDGSVRPGNWVPVEIGLVNSGPSVSGNLELSVQRRSTPQNAPNGSRVDYTIPVSVSEHGSKRFQTAVYVPPFFDEIQVRLVSGSQTIYRQDIAIRRVDPTEISCGIISPDPSAFASVNGLTLTDGHRQPRLVEIDPGDVPANAQLLSSLDCLIVSDSSTRGLSTLQQNALSTWVDNGGVLVVGTGASGGGTLAGLPPSLLPARMDGTVAVRSLSSLAGYFGGTADPNGPWLVANLKLTDGVPVVSDESQPLVVVGRRGKGAVFLSAFSFTQKPLRGWDGLDHLWSYVLSYVPIQASVFNSYYRQEYGWGRTPREALIQSPVGTDADSRRLLFGLIAFALLVGPINFLVLGRLGRRELALLSVPILATAATAGGLVYAARHQQGDVIVNQVSIARTWDGRGVGQMHSFVGIYALRARSFQLQVPLHNLLSASYFPMPGGFNRNTNTPSLRVVDNGAPTVQGLDLEPGSLRSFTVDGTLTAGGRVQSGISVQGNGLRGRIVNGLTVPLRGATLIAGSDVEALGDLPPGSGHDVSLQLKTASPVGTRDLLPVFEHLYPSRATDAVAARDPRYDILNAALNPSMGYGGHVETSGVTIFGWIDSPTGTIKDPSTRRDANQRLLFITNLPVRVGGQLQTIPPQLLEREQLTSSYSARADPNGITVNAGDEAGFEFRAPIDPAHFVVRGINLVSAMNVPMPSTLELFDWRAASWEQVPYATGNLTIPNPERYFSATGTLRIRFHYKPGGNGTPASITFSRFQVLISGVGR